MVECDVVELQSGTEESVMESPQQGIITEDDEDESSVELEGQDKNQGGDSEDGDTKEEDSEKEQYDDEDLEGCKNKSYTSSSKNKDPITIVDIFDYFQNS